MIYRAMQIKIDYVADRVGTSDVVLVGLFPTIIFSNWFLEILEINTIVKLLIRTKDIKVADILYADWGLPRRIISDRDPKFLSEL